VTVTPTSAAAALGSAVERLDPSQSQLLCRRINEHIVEISRSVRFASAIDIVCECATPGCFELIRIAPSDYDAVRRFPARFLVKPGHASDDERVIDEHRRFVVVEKTARDSDPTTRRASGEQGSPARTRWQRDWLWDGD
jgi:hypothetical protein